MRKNSHYNKRHHPMALHHLQRHQHPTQRPPRPPIPTLYQLDPQLPITHQPRQPTRRDPSYSHQLVPRLLVRTSPPQHRPLPRLRSTLHRRHFLQHHMPPRGLHLRPRRRLALVHQRRRLQLHPPLRLTPTTLNRDHRRTKRRTQSYHHDLADNENPTLPRPRQTQRPKTRCPKTCAELAERHSGVSP